MSNSVQPHRRQPTRLPRPWDFPGKNSGMGCHFLLRCLKVKSESEVTQSYLTISDPMDCSLPGSSIHGIFQARVLEWGAIVLPHILTPSGISIIYPPFVGVEIRHKRNDLPRVVPGWVPSHPASGLSSQSQNTVLGESRKTKPDPFAFSLLHPHMDKKQK